MEVASSREADFAASPEGGFIWPDFMPAFDATATLFDYLPEDRKKAMRIFFGWFPKLSAAFTAPASEVASS